MICPSRPQAPKESCMHRCRVSLLLLIGCLVLASAAADQRDLIILRANNQRKLAVIDSERSGVLLIRMTPNSPASEQRLSEVASWNYREMADGYWPQAVQARDQGRLAIAADMFNALSTTGDREWMKVYGAYNEGISWELLGDWTKAAEAFGRAAAIEPAHRLAMDAQYRQAFAYARLKNEAEASKIAAALDEIAKKDRNKGAEARARAIRATLAYNGGNAEELKKEGRAAVFPREDIEVAVQFGTFYADAQRQLGLLREARSEYERLLAIRELDAATRVPLQLGFAKTLLDEGDQASALVELLRIDALPYGSVDQKCEVRYLAGKLLAAGVVEAKAKGELTEAHMAQERTARLLLNAAANSSSGLTARSAAATELTALGPISDAPAGSPADAATVPGSRAPADGGTADPKSKAEPNPKPRR